MAPTLKIENGVVWVEGPERISLGRADGAGGRVFRMWEHLTLHCPEASTAEATCYVRGVLDGIGVEIMRWAEEVITDVQGRRP